MRSSDSSGADNAGQFGTTSWSDVFLSAQVQTPGSEEAREQLCRLYWYPLYAFIRQRGYNADDAKDLTQSFFLFLFDHKALERATPARGKFRSFLLASLKNYLSAAYHRENAIKRGGRVDFVSIDFDQAENRHFSEPTDSLTPEKIFDAHWAMTLLTQTMKQLRDEYSSQGRRALFETLKPFLDLSGSSEVPGYEAVARKLDVSVGGVKTLIHRFRKRYSEILRTAVAQTVTDPSEIDGEIHSLCDALVASEGRLRS